MVVGHLALALEELLHHRFTIEGERQRLADPLVRELAGIAAHPDLPMVRRLRTEGVEVRVVEEDCARVDVELVDGVDLVALVGRDHRPRLIEEGEFDGVERRAAAPPGLIPGVLGPGGLVVAVELPRAGAVGHTVLRRAGGVGHRCDERLGVEYRHEVREVAVRTEQRELHRGGVDRLGRALLDHATQAGVTSLSEAVHRRDDVVGREVAAVLPLHASAELERPGGVVVIGRPLGRETGSDVLVAGSRAHQELERLGEEAVRREVLHRDRVERRGGALDGDPDRAACLARRGGAGAGGCPGLPAGVVAAEPAGGVSQAIRIAEIEAMLRPTTVPRLMNSRRDRRPRAKASTTSSCGGVVDRRTRS